MKKFWGIIITALVAVTLTGCGSNTQSKSSNKQTTHKVVKASHKRPSSVKSGAKTSTAFSGQSYMGDWSYDMSFIAFKGNHFIWKYKAPVDVDKDASLFKLVSLQGTYDYSSNSKVITLNVNSQSKGYLGQDNDLYNDQYQSIASQPMPKKIHLKYRTIAKNGSKTLVPEDSGLYKDIPLYKTTDEPKAKYAALINEFGVKNIGSKMQKQSSTTTQDSDTQDSDNQSSDTQDSDSQSTDSQGAGFRSAQEFSEFLKDYDITSDDEVVSDGDSSIKYKGYYMENYTDAYANPGSVEPDMIVTAKYTVKIPSGQYEGIYIYDTHGRIYSGNSTTRLEVEVAAPLNTEYNKNYGD